MPTLTLKAPAKVNLYLRVVRKRRDGFHEIETVFERIGLYDTLTFRKTKETLKLSIAGNRLTSGKDNLVLRAAHLLRDRYKVKAGADIRLHKRIPVAAGLAGGSTDAAFTLIGLNRLWNLKLSRKTLLKCAAELGSDIPFFILESRFALGKGRGERLKKIPARARLWHVLVKPPLQVLTKHVYGGITPGLLTLPRPDARMLLNALRTPHPKRLGHYLFNTLEFVVMDKHPVIQKIRNDLLWEGVEHAMVSGSGPTVFGITASDRDAKRIQRIMLKKYPKAFVTAVPTF